MNFRQIHFDVSVVIYIFFHPGLEKIHIQEGKEDRRKKKRKKKNEGANKKT
jgi:hypothetical protein